MWEIGKTKERGDWISEISIPPDGCLLAVAGMVGQIVIDALTGQ